MMFGENSEVKPYVDPFPVDMINFEEKRVLVRIDQAATIEGKRVVVSDDLRQRMLKPKNPEPSMRNQVAQANGQAESSNKILIRLIKKKIEDTPRRWHEVLSEVLWAHRISKHGATKVTPFVFVFGQEVVLPIEINLQGIEQKHKTHCRLENTRN
jgi:hypothetical protein